MNVIAKLDFWGPNIKYTEALNKKKPPSSSRTAAASAVAQKVASGTGSTYLSNRPQRGKVVADVGWVETGSTVDALYSKLRREAAEVAVERNRLFQQYFITFTFTVFIIALVPITYFIPLSYFFN
jgi:hypothetical protein